MDNPIRQKCQEMLGLLDDIKKLREQRDGKVGNPDDIGKKLLDDFGKVDSLNSEIFNLINGKAVVVNEANINEVVQKKPAEAVKLASETVKKNIFGKPVIIIPKPSAPSLKPAVSANKPNIPQTNIAKPMQSNIPAAPAGPAIPELPPVPLMKGGEQKKQDSESIPAATAQVRPLILSPELASQKFKKLSDRQKEKYIQELAINYEEMQEFIKDEKAKNAVTGGREIKKEDYTIYSPKDEAIIANKYAKKYADSLIKQYPELFKPLFTQYKKVNMDYLSRSWVSMIIFYSVLSLPGSLILLLVLKMMFKGFFEIGFGIIILGTFLLPIAILVGMYFYPGSLIEDRGAKIRNELPFALIHMSSVAGSGAHPISIFELLTESNEYPELKIEIKKVLNYVNLFGYNLSTALKNTATTTPSQELKELLNGMVSTIETGGDLKGYLKGKSDDSLNNYRLDRKKEVEALGTYSEIYTSILIAAPLLLVVTLAIMNSITSTIAGMSIITLSYLGVGLGLPLLNIGFIVFLKSQVSNL